MDPQELPRTLTPKQVKEFMNIGIGQTYEVIRRPDFPKFYIGRSPRIPRDEFIQWYKENAGIKEKYDPIQEQYINKRRIEEALKDLQRIANTFKSTQTQNTKGIAEGIEISINIIKEKTETT